MKFKLLVSFILLCSMCLLNSCAIPDATYPHTAQVVGLNYHTDTVIVKTATGIFYSFYGTEDYMIGDLVSLTMDNSATPDNVIDDVIVEVRYSGYTSVSTI